MRELSYALDHAVWGFRPEGFHLTNVLLYACIVAAFYLVSRKTVGEEAAFLSALLFAVHPIHAEAVAWVSGRKDLLAAFFVILAWGSLSGEGKGRYVLGLFFYVAACLSKTAALPFPLAFWFLDRRRSWKALSPFLLVMAALGILQWRLAAGAGVAGR